jgi:hypothetical protein
MYAELKEVKDTLLIRFEKKTRGSISWLPKGSMRYFPLLLKILFV